MYFITLWYFLCFIILFSSVYNYSSLLFCSSATQTYIYIVQLNHTRTHTRARHGEKEKWSSSDGVSVTSAVNSTGSLSARTRQMGLLDGREEVQFYKVQMQTRNTGLLISLEQASLEVRFTFCVVFFITNHLCVLVMRV